MSRKRRASEDFIRSLPVLRVESSCAICADNFRNCDQITPLPCHHYFHHDCIVNWLKEANTCPLCRHEMPEPEEPSREQLLEQRMTTRSMHAFQRRFSSTCPLCRHEMLELEQSPGQRLQQFEHRMISRSVRTFEGRVPSTSFRGQADTVCPLCRLEMAEPEEPSPEQRLRQLEQRLASGPLHSSGGMFLSTSARLPSRVALSSLPVSSENHHPEQRSRNYAKSHRRGLE